jgi:hypothetical protein
VTDLLDYGAGKGRLAENIKPDHEVQICMYEPSNPEMDDFDINIEDDLYEAKKKKNDEATEDAEDIEDVELPNPDEFTTPEESAPEDELSTAASYATGDSKELINNLMSALESSKSTGNEKLTTQILNTLKFAIDQSINTK